LDRASDYGSEGSWFNSRRMHQSFPARSGAAFEQTQIGFAGGSSVMRAPEGEASHDEAKDSGR
ncbi:MAG TPA: hypothetical protein VI454_17100, partial [Verrucomicrobiae bacterium]